MIVGGGPIGVELAGEIRSAHPDKKITLVDSNDRLLSTLPKGVGRKAERSLSRRGISVKLSTRLEQDNSGYVDQRGEPYEADLVIHAIGITTNGIPVDGPESINDRGQLRVDEHMRVNGRENVFAIGDVTDVPEIKLGASARVHANTAAKNLIAFLKSPDARLKSYAPAKPMGLVTFGRRGGAAQLPFGRFDPMVAMKQKDMFVEMYLGKS